MTLIARPSNPVYPPRIGRPTTFLLKAFPVAFSVHIWAELDQTSIRSLTALRLTSAQEDAPESHTPIDLTSLLRSAAQRDHVATVSQLLAYADESPDVGPSASSSMAASLLADNAGTGYTAVVELLLSRPDVDPNGVGTGIMCPLATAAWRGNHGIMWALLNQEGTCADRRDGHGRTPLHWAVNGQQNLAMKMLMYREEVDVNARDNLGVSALAMAAGNGQLAAVKMLAEWEGIDINVRCDRGMTPLMEAAAGRHVAVIELLMQYEGLDVNAHDRRRRTALTCAAEAGCGREVAALLTRVNVDVNVRGHRVS